MQVTGFGFSVEEVEAVFEDATDFEDVDEKVETMFEDVVFKDDDEEVGFLDCFFGGLDLPRPG